jgi:hypothetical protein
MATSALKILEPKSLIRPTHWSKEVENAYRFQLAGYRDELEYKRVRQVAEVEKTRSLFLISSSIF